MKDPRSLYYQCVMLAKRTYPDWDNDAITELAELLLDTIQTAGENDDPRANGWINDRGRT